MTKTRWIIFGAICVLLIGTLVFLANKDRRDVSSIDAGKIIATTDGELGDQVYGNKDAKVIVFEYGDFQCPSCGNAYPQIKAIKEQYKDKIAFVFRHLPLTSIHPNALSAAGAAEAAGMQGKFWEMHDELYENQDNWSSASTSERNRIFETYAEAVGVNIDQYRTDLVSSVVVEKIARDRALAKRSSLDATPSILIGSSRLGSDIVSSIVQGDGAKLKAEIDRQLKAAGVELPKAE